MIRKIQKSIMKIQVTHFCVFWFSFSTKEVRKLAAVVSLCFHSEKGRPGGEAEKQAEDAIKKQIKFQDKAQFLNTFFITFFILKKTSTNLLVSIN